MTGHPIHDAGEASCLAGAASGTRDSSTRRPKVFAAKGFHQATIREIAETAGVSDGTIYNYFDNKFDLLIGLMARLAEVDHLPAEMSASLQGDVRDFFVTAFQHRLDRIEHGEGLLQAILPQVFVNPELREQFYRQYVLRIAALLEPYVQAQVEQGRLRPVDVPLTVRMVQSMFVGLLVMRILGDERASLGVGQGAGDLGSGLF